MKLQKNQPTRINILCGRPPKTWREKWQRKWL